MTRLQVTLPLLALLAACGTSDIHPTPAGPGPGEGVVAAFTLQDVNANSPTHLMDVTPRDQLMRVSAWYFGHAT